MVAYAVMRVLEVGEPSFALSALGHDLEWTFLKLLWDMSLGMIQEMHGEFGRSLSLGVELERLLEVLLEVEVRQVELPFIFILGLGFQSSED